ncbi:hypothetical protein CFP56_022934 [Quercus suber]|uniref:Uncharacterized protein n=1 Tax=Quercus suber TaxID=58331 RepID=A0AAW0KAE5_QUESU
MEVQLLLYHTTDGFQSSKINIFNRHFKRKQLMELELKKMFAIVISIQEEMFYLRESSRLASMAPEDLF